MNVPLELVVPSYVPLASKKPERNACKKPSLAPA
jgi:hypothetical protein